MSVTCIQVTHEYKIPRIGTWYSIICLLRILWITDSCLICSKVKFSIKHNAKITFVFQILWIPCYAAVRYEAQKIKVCLWNTDAPGGNKVQKAIFSFKVKVKVTTSLTLMSFERGSLVEYAYQIWSLYLLRFKNYGEG